LSERPWLHHPA